MGLMDVFKSFRQGERAGEQGAQPPQPSQPVPGTGAAAAATNSLVPSSATPQSDGSILAVPPSPPIDSAKSPMENYAKLWDKADTDAKPMDPAFQFKADPKKTMEAVSKFDYTKAIDPALLAKATSGDMSALIESFNSVAKVVAANAAQTTTDLVDHALREQASKYSSEIIPEVLRRERIRNETRSDNPIFENKAAAPMIQMVEQQMITKNPMAGPGEIKQMVKDYMNNFTQLVAESNGMSVIERPKPDPTARPAMDWESWATQNN